MSVAKVTDEAVKFAVSACEPAKVVIRLDRPVHHGSSICLLEARYVPAQETATLHDGKTNRSAPRLQASSDSSKSYACSAGAADDVEGFPDLGWQFSAATNSKRVTPTFGNQVEVTELCPQVSSNLGACLTAIRGAVQVSQVHTEPGSVGEHRVEWKVLFSPDDADGREAVVVPGRSGRANVVGVGTPERQQALISFIRCAPKIVLELTPFIPGYIRVNEVIAFQIESNIATSKAVIIDHLQRRRDHHLQPYHGHGPTWHVAHATR